MTRRLPFPEKQVVITCYASEHATGYVLLTEDYADTAEGTLTIYAPVAFVSRRFTGGQNSLTT